MICLPADPSGASDTLIRERWLKGLDVYTIRDDMQPRGIGHAGRQLISESFADRDDTVGTPEDVDSTPWATRYDKEFLENLPRSMEAFSHRSLISYTIGIHAGGQRAAQADRPGPASERE